jgi:hypothetical protein
MLFETIFGAATGLIGNVVSGIFNYKTAKLKIESDKLNNEHELKMVSAETDAMIQESKANIAINRAKIEGEVDLADANVYLQSQKEGNKNTFSNEWIDKMMNQPGKWKIITLPVATFLAFMFGLTDFFKGLIRPLLTAYLTGLTTWVTIMAWKIMKMDGVVMDLDTATGIFQDTTSIVIYLTVSCVTWWFGDRRMAKTIMQVMKGADRTKIDDKIVI